MGVRICVCSMPSKLEDSLQLWFYFSSGPHDSRPPRQGCGRAGRQGEATTTRQGRFYSSCSGLHPWQHCEASGWGGAVGRGPGREEEAGMREGKEAPPQSDQQSLHLPGQRAGAICARQMASKALPARGRLRKGFPLRADLYQCHPWSKPATGLGNLVHFSHNTGEKTEAHTDEMQGCE